MNAEEELYALLKEQGMTKYRLAKELGLSRQRVQAIFDGKRISLDVYLKILDALGYEMKIEKKEQ